MFTAAQGMKPASIRPPHATTNGGNGMVFTSALNLTFSTREKEQPSPVLVLRMSVRQIQTPVFEETV
jgi:hypothetical protein